MPRPNSGSWPTRVRLLDVPGVPPPGPTMIGGLGAAMAAELDTSPRAATTRTSARLIDFHLLAWKCAPQYGRRASATPYVTDPSPQSTICQPRSIRPSSGANCPLRMPRGLEATEPEAVGDHEHRRTGHRGPGDDGVE